MRREKQRYEKPAIKFVEIDLNSCIAVQASAYPGSNSSMLWGENSYQEKDVDNTSDKYVLPWLEVVKEIKPRQVMIYTIDRETPDHDLCKATHEELDRIAALIKEAGILVSVSY